MADRSMTLDEYMLRMGRLYLSWQMAVEQAEAAEKKAADTLTVARQIEAERDAARKEIERLRPLVPKKHRGG